MKILRANIDCFLAELLLTDASVTTMSDDVELYINSLKPQNRNPTQTHKYSVSK